MCRRRIESEPRPVRAAVLFSICPGFTFVIKTETSDASIGGDRICSDMTHQSAADDRLNRFVEFQSNFLSPPPASAEPRQSRRNASNRNQNYFT